MVGVGGGGAEGCEVVDVDSSGSVSSRHEAVEVDGVAGPSDERCAPVGLGLAVELLGDGVSVGPPYVGFDGVPEAVLSDALGQFVGDAFVGEVYVVGVDEECVGLPLVPEVADGSVEEAEGSSGALEAVDGGEALVEGVDEDGVEGVVLLDLLLVRGSLVLVGGGDAAVELVVDLCCFLRLLGADVLEEAALEDVDDILLLDGCQDELLPADVGPGLLHGVSDGVGDGSSGPLGLAAVDVFGDGEDEGGVPLLRYGEDEALDELDGLVELDRVLRDGLHVAGELVEED